MIKSIFFFLSACAVLPVSATDTFPTISVMHSGVPSSNQRETITKSNIKNFNSRSSAVSADFTIEGSETLAPVYTFNFDNDMQGWTADATTYVTWKQITDPADSSKAFSTIDPTSTGSLFVEGPYQTYRREISAVTSQKMDVPANGAVSFYIAYSINYDDCCRLTLSISTDGFSTSEELWNSGESDGQKPWHWRQITLNLDKYVGQTVQLRFTYGPGTADNFGTGGYLGDFVIDNLIISGRKAIENLEVSTGEKIHFFDISTGDITEWEWHFPGAWNEVSHEQNPEIYYTNDGAFDVSLTVKDAAGNTSTKTRTSFVTVKGTAPVAAILPPATFRLSSNRKPLVAPLAPVTFKDMSTGFPTSYGWGFTGVSSDPAEIFYSSEKNPTVSMAYLHDQTAVLVAQNSHGSSTASCEFTAEYSGVINNLRPEDRGTVFDMEDWGVFPGSNTRKITAYAERFSAPSVPVMVTGAYVFFNEAKAEEVTEQVSNVGVHLYTSKDGKPDKCLDSWWWMVFELDTPATAGSSVGTAFPFTEAPFVDDEFFIVVDGIPAYNETTRVSFGMAGFRNEGNTALMLKDGEWIEVSDYFPAGQNHTSFMIYPEINHSVMASLNPADAIVTVDRHEGTVDFEIFSYLGYETPEIDCDWLKVISEPNGLTVDTIKIAYDALPASLENREGHIRLTDGATELLLTVNQNGEMSVDRFNQDNSEDNVIYYNLQGLPVVSPNPGDILIRHTPAGSSKIRY